MDEYIVSARKYRPMSFDSVVGQQALTTTLKNAVKSGKLAHAYLFCGPRGVGKTTCARIFAKAINCENPTNEGEACNECESCKAFAEGRSYNIFELDAASNNSVENIKTLMEQTRIPPQVGRYKVFIIDEAHMLSTAAFNNHLKAVAEKENIQYDEQALNIIAEKADGGMRDALSIFDQAASFSQGNITYQKVIEDLNVLDEDNYFNIINLALENKVSDIMVLLNNVINKGFDGGHLINGLASHVRNVLMAKDVQTLPLLEVSEQQRKRYQEQAQKCPTLFLYNALKIMNQCDVEYRQSSNKRLLVELTLIQVAQITQKDDDVPASGRSPKRLKSLFKNLIVKAQQKPTQQVVGSLRHHHEESHKSTDNETPVTIAPSSNNSTEALTSNQSGAAVVTHGLPTSINLGGMGLSVSNLLKGEERKNTNANEPEVTNKEEKEEFSQQELIVQWRAMCKRMPNGMQALAQRMGNITPTITAFPNIQILAENNIQLSELLPIKARIRATLAKYLHNGQLEVDIRLAKQEEIKPMLTPHQELEKLKKENQPVLRLIEALSLDLA